MKCLYDCPSVQSLEKDCWRHLTFRQPAKVIFRVKKQSDRVGCFKLFACYDDHNFFTEFLRYTLAQGHISKQLRLPVSLARQLTKAPRCVYWLVENIPAFTPKCLMEGTRMKNAASFLITLSRYGEVAVFIKLHIDYFLWGPFTVKCAESRF